MENERSEALAAGIVTANHLRRVAEWADGMRGKDFALSMTATLPDGSTGFGLEPLSAGPLPVGSMHVRTERKVPAEKFLVPYYVRFLDAPAMQKLLNAIAHPNVIAIAHTYPTFFRSIETAIEPALLAVNTHGFVNDGFVRLSDWMEEAQ